MSKRRAKQCPRALERLRPNAEAIAAHREGFAILHFLVYFVDSDEGQRSEQELTSTFHAARASAVWKRVERADPFDDQLRYSACGIRTALGDVVADTLEIVGSVRGPAD